MKILSHLKLLLAASSALWISTAAAQEPNSTFYNPILPGWHSDPSCVHVNETFFCVSSTFISFPGLPIYASADLIDWKLVSHVWNRESQIPGASRNTTGQQLGFYAATLRYHDGFFYIACPCKFLAGRTQSLRVVLCLAWVAQYFSVLSQRKRKHASDRRTGT
jgi:beta-xylosidase